MKVQINIDESHDDETVIIIQAKEWTDELAALVQKLKQSDLPKRLIGVEEERSIVLDPPNIDYIYAENRKVMAAVGSKKIELKMKLYEVEELLAGFSFLRFSKSVIGNVDKISRFEMMFNGNLCVYFQSGNKEYVSRAYVADLKKKLIMGGGRDDR